MMHRWTSELDQLFRLLLGDPGAWTTWVLLAAGILSALVVLFLTANLFGIPMPTWPRVTGVFAIAVGLMVLAAIAARLHLAPRVRGDAAKAAVVIGAAAAMFLLVVVPIQGRVERGKYLPCALNLVLSLVAAALTIQLVRAGLLAAQSGSGDVRRLRHHNVETEQFIE